MKIFFFICLVSFLAKAQDTASDLMSAFGGRCLSTGNLGASGESNAISFESIAGAIKKDSKCDGIRTALRDFQTANSDFSAYKKVSDMADLEGNVSDLELAVASERKASNDPTQVALLETALSTARIDLISKRQSQDYRSGGGKTNAIRNVDAVVKNLLSQIANSRECTDKPAMLSGQIAGQLLNLGSNILSGAGASYLLFGSTLVDSVFSYFRDKPIAEALRNVTLSRRAEAIGCSLEGVAASFCQARDIEKLQQAQSEGTSCPECTNKGLRILNDHLSAFVDWASRMNAGSPAVTDGQAIDKKNSVELRATIDKTRIDLLSIISQRQKTVNDAPDGEKADELLGAAEAVSKFIATNSATGNNVLTGAAVVGVFSDEFREDKSCGPYAYIFSKGVDRKCEKANIDQSCMACVLAKYKAPPPVEAMRTQSENILATSRVRAEREITKINESDPVLVLAKVNSPYGVGNHTAKEFLKNTSDYFKSRLEDPQSVVNRTPPLRQAIVATKENIDKSLEAINSTRDKSIVDLGDIAKRLISNGDIYYVGNNLNELVKQEFADGAKGSLKAENASWLSQYSVNETMNQLLAIYGGEDQIAAQVEKSKSQNRVILDSISKGFGDSFTDRIRELEKEGSPKLAALYCMRALIVPGSEQNSDLKKACQGKVYKSAVPGANLEMNFDKLASDKDGEKRICSIYEFSRKSKILSNQRKAK